MGGIKQTPYNEGVNAKRNGKGINSNPYSYMKFTDEVWENYVDWREGWHEADKTTDDCENGRGDDGNV